LSSLEAYFPVPDEGVFAYLQAITGVVSLPVVRPSSRDGAVSPHGVDAGDTCTPAARLVTVAEGGDL